MRACGPDHHDHGPAAPSRKRNQDGLPDRHGFAEQTRAIFDALADDGADESDLGQWQALQTWLAAGPCKVVVPFAKVLAALVPPLAVRLRRDFRMVLTLVGAHALLHQASRLKDDKGRVIATIREDYATVRSLVADLVATGVEASVSKAVRETVRATADIIEEHGNSYEVNQSDLADRLRLDKGAVWREESVSAASWATCAITRRGSPEEGARPASCSGISCPRSR